MPRSSLSSSFSSSSSDGTSRSDASPSLRTVSTRTRRPPCRGCNIVAKYPHGLPDPSNELEIRYATLDAAKVTARALVAADDLIVRIFDDPRLRLQVSSISRGSHEHTKSDYSHFKRSFRSAFGKNANIERTAETFTRRMQDQGLVEKDEDSAVAFSNLCLRYAQLKYRSSRVAISQVVLNHKIQSRILATSDIPKGTLMLELGGLMSADAIMSDSLDQGSKKRKREEVPQYNMFSVIRKGARQCGPGASSDRLLLGPARFVNHSCRPNSKLKPFPKTNAWGIESSKDILAGEEITVHYGKQYFFPGECVCTSCQTVQTAADKPEPEPEPEPHTPQNPYPTPPAEPTGCARHRKRARTGS